MGIVHVLGLLAQHVKKSMVMTTPQLRRNVWMGSRLRNYKKKKTRNEPIARQLVELGRLTDKVIEKMQTFYGQS